MKHFRKMDNERSRMCCWCCCLKNTCKRNDTDGVKKAEVIELQNMRKGKELNVWVPLTSLSTGTYNFYVALEHELKKYGIRLRKIQKENLEDVVHAIAICNFCTRPEADFKEVCNLTPVLQSKLFIIIVYLNREHRNTGNIKYVKDRCKTERNIVEMVFTSKLDRAGIKDKENKEALDKLKAIFKSS